MNEQLKTLTFKRSISLKLLSFLGMDKFIHNLFKTFMLFSHSVLKMLNFFFFMSLVKLLKFLETSSNTHHEFPIYNLGWQYLSAIKIFAWTDTMNWNPNILRFHDIFDHLIHEIIRYALVLNCLFKLLFNKGLNSHLHQCFQKF